MAVLATALAACSERPQNAIYSHDQCNRLALIDNVTGKPVVGAEDIVKLPGGDLLITAYDRRQYDEDGKPLTGGIYRLSATDFGASSVRVTSLFDTMPGGLRPHGVDAAPQKDGAVHVAFVNRGYKGDQLQAQIVAFNLKGQTASPPTVSNTHCRANDVIIGTARQTPNYVVTADRSACGGLLTMWENTTARAWGSLVQTPAIYNGVKGFNTGLSFPNGIGIQFKDRPLGDHNFIAIAETRANRLRYLPKTERRDMVALPGSPDNITVGKPGIIIAAVHPSLFKLALYRHGWSPMDRAPSRVVKVTGDEVLTLFDDPTGALYSAATVAVQTAGRLVLGSVGDAGVLVCSPRKVS